MKQTMSVNLFTSSVVIFRFSLGRFFTSTIGYTLALLAYYLLAPPAVFTQNSNIFFFIVLGVAFSVTCRVTFWVRYRKFLKKENEIEFIKVMPTVQKYFLINALLTAMVWSSVGIYTFAVSGPFKPESMFMYLILFGICSTGAPTYAANSWVWNTFTIITIGLPTLYSAGVDFPHNFLPALVFAGTFYFVYLSGTMSIRQTQLALEENHVKSEQLQYLQSIIESVPGLVTVFDKDLNYILTNSKVSEFSGIPRTTFKNKKAGFAKNEEFSKTLQKFAASNSSRLQNRMEISGAHGNKWFIVTMSRVLKTSQIIVVSMDISDHIAAERAAMDQRLKTESTARLAALGELASGIAHEINNPLTIITSKASQILRRPGVADSPEIKMDLDKISSTAYRIANIVRGMRNLSRDGDSDPFIVANLKEVVQDVLSVSEAKCRNYGITIAVNCDGKLAAKCRPTQIAQVLVNLIGNSFHAIQGQKEAWIKIDVTNDSKNIEISVTDSGTGISQDVAKKLMTPFFTTKAAGVGTGLGLSISRRIANDHKGELTYDDKCPNTRFVLRFPVNQTEILAS